MSIWWLIPAFVGLVGVLMLVGGIMAVFKAKFGSGILRVLFGGLTLAGAMIAGLIGLNLQTYAALSKERLAGQVILKKVGDHNYTASIDLADDGKHRAQHLDILPRLKAGDSQFTEQSPSALTCRQDLPILQGLTPPVRRPIRCVRR